MTALAYMVKDDWTHDRTSMAAGTTTIRTWLGDGLKLFAVVDPASFTPTDRAADYEAAQFLTRSRTVPRPVSVTELAAARHDARFTGMSVVVIHPAERHFQAVRMLAECGTFRRIMVLTWARGELLQLWLEGQGATNLHTDTTAETDTTIDPILLAAARALVKEAPRGLSSGVGKDAVVQLLHTFTEHGYPADRDTWLRAFFAAGGTFTAATAIAATINEIHTGIRHRRNRRYVPYIFEKLTHEASTAEPARSSSTL